MSYLRDPLLYLVVIFIGLNLLATGHGDGLITSELPGQAAGVSVSSLAAVPHTETVWAVGRSGFAASSVDSGRTWRRRAVHVTANMVRVLFVSNTVGWIGAEPATLFRTRDGGQTWDEQPRIASEPITGFHFVDADAGWIVASSGSILATSDGGTTWIKQRSGKGAESALADVRFIDQLRGWAVGADLVLRTTDGGSSWKPQAVPVSAIWTRIFFADATHGWIVGERSSVLHTVDGGATWTPQVVPAVPKHFFSIVASDDFHALLVGVGDGMLSTADGGHHWLAESVNDTVFATTAELSGTNVRLAAGTGIIRSLDGGPWTRVCCAGLR
jgi:photosystem II stability/assembly factor-like uncharacterized protein